LARLVPIFAAPYNAALATTGRSLAAFF